MLFLVLIWTHDICLDQAGCMVLCSWSADQIVLCSCAAATHPKHHAHFLFWACSTERSVFSKDAGGNRLMLVQPSFTLPLISLVRALAYTGIQEGGDVWYLSGEAGCRAVLNGKHLALQGKMFFFSLSFFVLLFHVTVEAPFLLLPSSSHFILIVGHTVLIVSFCCAWGKLGCWMKLSGSFNLTLYDMGTLSVVHIVLTWAVCDRAALFEEKFGLAGVGVGEFCFGNRGYVCQLLVLLKLKCFLLLAPFLWLFLSPFSHFMLWCHRLMSFSRVWSCTWFLNFSDKWAIRLLNCFAL